MKRDQKHLSASKNLSFFFFCNILSMYVHGSQSMCRFAKSGGENKKKAIVVNELSYSPNITSTLHCFSTQSLSELS